MYIIYGYNRGHGSMEQGLRAPGSPGLKIDNGKISPEIHPVSAHKNKRKTFRDLCRCCRPSKPSNGNSWRLPWFKKRNESAPPPPPKVEKKGMKLSMPSLFSCNRCKGKFKRKKATEPKVTQVQSIITQSSPPPRVETNISNQQKKENLFQRIFCFCCKKKEPAHRVPALRKRNFFSKLLCCCSKKSTVRPKQQQSQELLKNRRKELSKSRTTSIQSGFSKLEYSLVEHSSMMRGAIPVLPICLAWTCLLLNVFLPGTGTITSGLLCLCFGKPRFSVNDTAIARFGSFFVNLVIGIGQSFTIIFCLVGWGWSIWWGVIMLRLARKHRRIKLAEKGANTMNQNHDTERGRR